MKYVPFTLLSIFLSVIVSAQERPAISGANFRYMNIWSKVSASTSSINSQPAIAIDSASGVISIRVTDPQAEATLKIYEMSGNLLYQRPLGPGNNIITLSGMTRKVFVLCVQYNGSPLYCMKVVRKEGLIQTNPA
jgi:hypothetical protein